MDKAVNTREALIKDMLKYNDRQTKIPFLPKKYKEYHPLKTSGLNHYQNSFRVFKKTYEDMNKVFILWKKLDDLRHLFANGITNLNADPKAEEKIKNVLLAKDIIKESDQLLKDETIDKDLNDYFNFESQKLLDAYDYYLKSKEKQFTDFSWNKMTGIISRQSGLPEVETIALNWKESCFGEILREREGENKIADQEIVKSAIFYLDNKLNLDFISKILSKFSSKYPRIK